MLVEAGIKHILVDPSDLRYCPTWEYLALDCGSYRIFKRGGTLDIPAFLETASSRPFDFVLAPDRVKNPVLSHLLWEQTKRLYKGESPLLPVWQYSPNPYFLQKYLGETQLVAIGGLVPLMREKDEEMLRRVIQLCEAYPNRLHILGCNWLKAIERLNDTAYSFDSSKWLDSARYGHLIFTNTRTKRLSACKQTLLGLNLTRQELCIQSAKNLEAFVFKTDPALSL